MGDSPVTPVASPIIPQSKEGDEAVKNLASPYKFLVCENVISLAFLPVISMNDPTEIGNTLVQMVKDYDNSLPNPPPSTATVSILIPLADKSSKISILNQESGKISTHFDVTKIASCTSMELKDPRGFLVFTYLDDSTVSAIGPKKTEYRCFVFICSSIFESCRLVTCINEMVQSLSSSQTPGNSLLPSGRPLNYLLGLKLHVDIREAETKSSLGSASVQKDKEMIFKFHCDQDKILVLGVSQTTEGPDVPPVRIRKCNSIGMAYGRYVNADDIVELMANAAPLSGEEAVALIPEASTFVTKASWSPKAPQFINLNTVTDRDRFVFFTVACNMQLENVPCPLFLGCICKAKISQKDLSSWLPAPKRHYVEEFSLNFEEIVDERKGWILLNRFKVTAVTPATSNGLNSLSASKNRKPSVEASSPNMNGSVKDDTLVKDSIDDASCIDEDDDEPLLSGNGGENLCCMTDEQVLQQWNTVITEWRAVQAASAASQVPSLPPPPTADDVLKRSGAESLPDGLLGRRIRQLVRCGIPDSLRREVWQLLAGFQGVDAGLTEAYRILLTKPCKFDAEIRRDLPRTFPAHDFFKNVTGQETLFQLVRAYALYDNDVGYGQNVSFISAALLLCLPEEEAFCLLVKIMSNYGTRLAFMKDCGGLFRCLYQFERLLQDMLPEVARGFEELGVKAHMYASQWFLTLFATKFPLPLTFRIFDIFLSEGLLFIFKVMISLMKVSRSSLLGLDFEGTLKYFRVTLPKRFRAPEACDELINMACNTRITASRLIKYARDFEKRKEEEERENSPSAELQRQLCWTQEQVSRLENENSSLANKLLAATTDQNAKINELEMVVETLREELKITKDELLDCQEQCEFLKSDTAKVKAMLRDEVKKVEEKTGIIEEYKTITANLSRRLNVEEQAKRENNFSSSPSWKVFVDAVTACNGLCRERLDGTLPGWASISEEASNVASDDEVESLRKRVHDLELELAQKKADLVSVECQRQTLSHDLIQATAELNQYKAASESAFTNNPRLWLAKKWTTATSRGSVITNNTDNGRNGTTSGGSTDLSSTLESLPVG